TPAAINAKAAPLANTQIRALMGPPQKVCSGPRKSCSGPGDWLAVEDMYARRAASVWAGGGWRHLPSRVRAVKLGALVWHQYTDWQSLRDTGAHVDRLGYDSLWTWDHLYPVVGDHTGPMFEGYVTLAGWAEHTERVRLGLMVGANTFRNPGLVVKMVTALDHMSGGRMWLGIGGAWFETEHTAFGIEFGSGFGERLDWFDESVELMKNMLPGGPASARGRFYHAKDVLNNPPPVQEHLPIMIGGSGERKTLHTVAKHADGWNT